MKSNERVWKTNEEEKYSSGVGEWPDSPKDCDRDYCIAKGSDECQHAVSYFTSPMQFYDNEKACRSCQKSRFTHVHKFTKKHCARNWLCYSVRNGSLFYFMCKLMKSGGLIRFTQEVLNQWKMQAILYIGTKKTLQAAHNQTLISLLVLKHKGGRINFQIVQQTESEKKFWPKLLELVIEVIKFVYSFLIKNMCSP